MLYNIFSTKIIRAHENCIILPGDKEQNISLKIKVIPI